MEEMGRLRAEVRSSRLGGGRSRGNARDASHGSAGDRTAPGSAVLRLGLVDSDSGSLADALPVATAKKYRGLEGGGIRIQLRTGHEGGGIDVSGQGVVPV